MEEYQSEFISFLIEAGVLTFGNFTTKSGRKTPYFINTGNFNSGRTIAGAGTFYARHVVARELTDTDVIFGPAYKGIPLAVATGVALSNEHSIDKGVTFDRKEAKTHGDGGVLVGHKIQAGESVMLVEDVVTAGTTLREMVPRLREEFKANVSSVVIAVDRSEKGSGDLSAVEELEQSLSITIHPLVSIHTIIEYLHENTQKASGLPDGIIDSIKRYLEQYGA